MFCVLKMHFSIISPSYNQLRWLQLCIASVQDQGGSAKRKPGAVISVDHIVQDAGTPGIEDFTREISANFHKEEYWVSSVPGHRIAVHREPDSGMYDAINKGMEKAEGEIIGYLNCDEQFLPGALARVAGEFARDPRVDFLFGDALLVDEGGRCLSYRRAIAPSRLHTRLDHLATLSCTMFFRRKIFDAGHRFSTDWKMIGDAVFIDACLRAGARCRAISVPLATFTMTGANIGQSEAAANESQAWRTTPDAPPAWLRKPAVLHHRIRKALAGAYRRRDVTYSIYTLESRKERLEFNATSVGWDWTR